jgi:uncharacterized surface protein with fasciclin (FAS1) repeats
MRALGIASALFVSAVLLLSLGSTAADSQIIYFDCDLTLFRDAMVTSGVINTIQVQCPFTIFAPVNEAFTSLPRETRDYLMAPENKEVLASILKYHILAHTVRARNFNNLYPPDQVATVLGPIVYLSRFDECRFVNDAGVLQADIYVGNGVMHKIDHILIPPGLTIPGLSCPTPVVGSPLYPASPPNVSLFLTRICW